MPILRTLEERGPSAERTVRLLTCVLSYDDLIAPPAQPFVLGAALRIGRADDDRPLGLRAPGELRAPDRWLSGEHATVERRGDADVIRDAGSRNGTWVNGRAVTEHRLASGDLVEVGHLLFCYRVAGEADAARVLEDEPALGPTGTLCPAVAALAADLERVAPSREPVLLLGETGTGKEVAAAMVHAASGRRGPCVVVDCGAVPETLFEATFFGHRRGAFTGASEPRVGEITRAHGGTLVLDELGNLSAASQAKLLRVIEDGRVTPLGGAEATAVDVRWIAATNRELVGDAGFRSDLYQRLAGYVARLPPLRERREDLGLLAAHLLEAAEIRAASCTAAAGRALFTSAFAGNVRELRARLRSAALLAAGGAIDVAHVEPAAPAAAPPPAATAAERRGPPTAEEVTAALARARGNVVHAAASLGAHPRQVYRWLARYGIAIERFRE
jgi:DNA-binding NtrC family response regulator